MSHQPKVRSRFITEFARGNPCTLRLDGICAHVTFSPNAGKDEAYETSVWAHLDGHAKGTSTKENDNHGCIACFWCHDVIDMRNRQGYTALGALVIARAMLRALSESQYQLIQAGIISVKGHEVHHD